MTKNSENNSPAKLEPLVFLVLTILVLLLYWQTTGFQFINLDDNTYIYENPIVSGGLNKDSFLWAFTTFNSANWHPLTWLSHLLDVKFFGLNAGAHHGTNVIFHLINSALAFLVFHKMTGTFWKSAVIAALFAVHPAHVESVAWIAERKDVLSTMFWLLTMLAYFRYAKDASKAGFPTSVSYWLIVLLFALGLMAKPMLVTLPFVLLLCDFWALERLKKLKDLPPLIVEKLPLFALSAISCVVTIFAQRSGGAVQTLDRFPLDMRIWNSIVAYVKYIAMLFYPVNLSLWYPYDKNLSIFEIAGAAAILIGITAFCISQRSERKYLLMGWLWFLGTLVPVIGIVQVGAQPLADRYTYVPYFGLFIMLVWSAGELVAKLKLNKYAVAVLAAIIILILSVLSFRQISHWKNDESIYVHALSVTTGNYLVMQNYCSALMLAERLDEAEKQCRDSIAVNAAYVNAQNTLGVILLKRGNFSEAAEHFERSIELDPGFAHIYINLSVAQSLANKPEEAEQNLQKAASLMLFEAAPEMWIGAMNDLAIAYAKQNNYEKAAENYGRLLMRAPGKTDARANYAVALFTLEKYKEAQTQIEEAIRQDPKLAESYNLLGLVLLRQNKREEAAKHFENALKLKPDYAEAKLNLKRTKSGTNTNR